MLGGFSEREAEVLGHDKTVYVAFVFAGSARSFIIPAVHESIRTNLIETLCPEPLCDAHIYTLLSRADNTHTPNDAVGKMTRVGEKDTSIISKVIDYALGRLSGSSKAFTAYMDTASPEERQTMIDHAKSLNATEKMRHDMYRNLDPRRYSMHFSRHRAYQMMLKREKEATKGSGYDWVVHVRFDTAWSEPISQSIFSFDHNHITSMYLQSGLRMCQISSQ